MLPLQVAKGRKCTSHVDITASSNIDAAETAIEQSSVPDADIPKHYKVVTDHEAKWLQAFYTKQVAFLSPHSIEPNALKAPRYRQKKAILAQKNRAEKSDMNSLLFAEFVCAVIRLRHKGHACFDAVRGDAFLQLAPPA